jgi:hypothetical protein
MISEMFDTRDVLEGTPLASTIRAAEPVAASNTYDFRTAEIDEIDYPAPTRADRRAWVQPLRVAAAIAAAFVALAIVGNVVAYALGPWGAPVY